MNRWTQLGDWLVSVCVQGSLVPGRAWSPLATSSAVKPERSQWSSSLLLCLESHTLDGLSIISI